MNHPKVRETDVLKAITAYLKLDGWEVYRTNNAGVWNQKKGGYFFHGQKGYPDITALKKGCPVLFVEVKGPSGRLTKAQERFAILAKDCHCIYILARSLDDVINTTKDLTRATKRYYE